MSDQVKVPKEVYDTICAIRLTGAVNMLDVNGVKKIAKRMKDKVTPKWIDEHRKEYSEGIFYGFVVES